MEFARLSPHYFRMRWAYSSVRSTNKPDVPVNYLVIIIENWTYREVPATKMNNFTVRKKSDSPSRTTAFFCLTPVLSRGLLNILTMALAPSNIIELTTAGTESLETYYQKCIVRSQPNGCVLFASLYVEL